MLRPAQTGRLLRRSVRICYLPSSSIPRASQFALQCRNIQPTSIATRSFSCYRRFQQQATAPADTDEVRHASPELTKFSELADEGIIHPRIINNITNMGIHTMTDVQRMTINECLDGSDVIAQAKTGTGKTIAFIMPIIQRLMRDLTLSGARATIEDTRALIVSPTRELAEQIAAETRKVCANTHIQIHVSVGGTGKQRNLQEMRHRGCHILVATPGRLKDLLSDSYSGVKLNKISTFVLDEADRLLDIGFAPDIMEIQSYMPPRVGNNRQTLMFSATVPRSVVDLVRQTLRPDFKFIRTVDPDEQPTHERIPQSVVFLPGLQNQVPAITEIAMNAVEEHKKDPENTTPFKAIIFLPSKNEVELTRLWLENLRSNPSTPGATARGYSGAHPLEGVRILSMSANLDQRQRTYNSTMFRNAQSAILVASDVVARGMDFPNVTHVIQAGLPANPDQYIHRVGRTGRAGKAGQGWLLLQEDDRREWEYTFSKELRLKEDSSLHTAKLDMSRGAQLPANITKLMQCVENGVRAVPYSIKAKTYTSLMGVIKQQNTKRSPQTIIDMINEYARFGWGMERPPPVNASLASKLGFNGVRGLELEDGRDRMNDRGGMGGRLSGGGSRGGFNRNDPFGQGMGGGTGVSRGFGGDGDFGGGRSGGGRGGGGRGGGGRGGGRGGGGFGGERGDGGFGGGRGGRGRDDGGDYFR